ncbi:MAG TPA: lamin tail domain-containing protein [Candidatus Cloacimonadota bacterium]|nr:lamin tail domain-containing protein [Candidatus Cloacimonadota bacterium]
MKRFLFFCFILFVSFLQSQNVVINEVLYDPAGTDSGYEWIELYNHSDTPVNLADWKIEKAGTGFGLVFIFNISSNPIISPHSYLLIGEINVLNADFTATLAFQNGGSATDGIRLVSADSLYTDTVLYDAPNTNNLPDDISNPGIYFAVDVEGGHSLARKQNGVDTNNSEADFFECDDPTPGTANFLPVDLAIYELEIVPNDNEYWLETEIFNLSTQNVDNFAATLEVTINNTFLGSYNLPEIPAENSVPFSVSLGEFLEGYSVTSAELIYLYDNMLENNAAVTSILIGQTQLVINEILFRPESTNQEWLEIFNRSACGYLVDNFKIIDASGGEIGFSGSLPPHSFRLICAEKNSLLQIYPELDSTLVIEAASWTSLNNTEESLILSDNIAAVFDSVYYDGSACPLDYSFERVNPFDDENVQWLVSLDSLGTPGQPNSTLPVQKDLCLEFIGINSENEEITHTVFLENVGLENITSALLSCYQICTESGNVAEAYSSEIALTDSLIMTFCTEVPSCGYYRYEYGIFSEEDLNSCNDQAISFFNRDALPFVINEIMYDPPEEQPEWLELKKNLSLPDMTAFYLIVDEDTLLLPFRENEFVLITANEAAAAILEENYNLSETEILLGLPALSNNGEQLSLLDECGNLIESFCFLPKWNNALSGVSLERVNSILPADENNWGPAVSGCTPGTENSIFIQVLPAVARLYASPNPFSPYRGEHTIFSVCLPEIISTMTLRIFDLKGRMLRKLVNQELVASEGNIVWDGRNDSGKKLPIGVYIVLLEATSRESEKVYEKKTTVVIGK